MRKLVTCKHNNAKTTCLTSVRLRCCVISAVLGFVAYKGALTAAWDALSIDPAVCRECSKCVHKIEIITECAHGFLRSGIF